MIWLTEVAPKREAAGKRFLHRLALKNEQANPVWHDSRSTTYLDYSKLEDGRIAVKVINDLGDDVMKVFRV